MTGLERLRDLVDGMIGWRVYTIMNNDWCSRNGVNVRGDGVAMKELLREIADQIEREHLREVDDISGRDADAIARVESHGGIKECDRKVEASMEVGDKYTLLRMELGKMLGYDLMGQLDASDEELVEKVGKRLMPEGMEWPRFEDGEPVKLGDEFENAKGNVSVLRRIMIKDSGEEFGGEIVWRLNRGDAAIDILQGGRIKRPAPKVLDSKGVECNVGDAVWWVRNKTGNFRIIRIEQYGKCAIHDDDADEPCGMTVPSTELTHERPVIDADGVEIREGDVLYSVEPGDYVIVDSIEPGNPWFATTDSELQHCSKFTHRAPAIAADGKPLLVGETVFTVNLGIEGVVERIERQESDTIVHVRFIGDNDCAMREPSDITHERDSWERLEEDKDLNPFEYCKEVGHKLDTCENAERFKANDIVRRCKRLAGVS